MTCSCAVVSGSVDWTLLDEQEHFKVTKKATQIEYLIDWGLLGFPLLGKNRHAILYIQVRSQVLSVAHQYLVLILKPTSLLRIQFHNVDLNSWIIETPWSKCMSDVPSINPKYSNASGLISRSTLVILKLGYLYQYNIVSYSRCRIPNILWLWHCWR